MNSNCTGPKSAPEGALDGIRGLDSDAFTLVEVLLAISIATGLLLAAILFYQQTADLRSQILSQGDRYAQIRLVLDRLVSDLRTARARPGDVDAFSGNGTAIRFFRSSWTGLIPGGASVAASGGSDLTQVTVFAVQSLDGTNRVVTGIERIEEPIGRVRQVVAAPGLGVPLTPNRQSSTSNFFPGDTRTGEAAQRLGSSAGRPDALSDVVRFVQFRYWDGLVWVDGWTNSSPPLGVEITLSCEPVVEGTNSGEYASEMFRRVLFIPGGVALRKPEPDGAGAVLSP